MAPSDMAPQSEIQSVHPTTKLGYSPSPRRTMTYCPPERAIIAPGSTELVTPDWPTATVPRPMVRWPPTPTCPPNMTSSPISAFDRSCVM